jgi:hypothetical protein
MTCLAWASRQCSVVQYRNTCWRGMALEARSTYRRDLLLSRQGTVR